jgi:hypothetical protein
MAENLPIRRWENLVLLLFNLFFSKRAKNDKYFFTNLKDLNSEVVNYRKLKLALGPKTLISGIKSSFL